MGLIKDTIELPEKLDEAAMNPPDLSKIKESRKQRIGRTIFGIVLILVVVVFLWLCYDITGILEKIYISFFIISGIILIIAKRPPLILPLG